MDRGVVGTLTGTVVCSRMDVRVDSKVFRLE